MPVSVHSGCRRFLLPGPAAIRSATSFWIIPVQQGMMSLFFQHLEKYLAGDVVWVITGQNERLSVEQPVKIHFQKIVFDNVIFQ